MKTLFLCAGLVLSSCARPEGTLSTGNHVQEKQESSTENVTTDTIQWLALSALGRRISSDEMHTLTSRGTNAELLIDSLLDFPDMYKNASAMLFPYASPAAGQRLPQALRTIGSGEKTYYAIAPAVVDFGQRAYCKFDETVLVKPWWDPGKEIRICKDNYQPDRKYFDKEGKIHCNGTVAIYAADHAKRCGCGPNLINCGDGAAIQGLVSGSRFEFDRTIEELTKKNVDLRDLLVSNETFREAFIEFYYGRWEVLNGRLNLNDLIQRFSSWPKEGRWAPRNEIKTGQHAGILTTRLMLDGRFGPRMRMQQWSEDLWCIEQKSVQVQAPQLLALHTANFREFNHEKWAELAHKPLCNRCHARLDYGMQFFGEYGAYPYTEFYEPTKNKNTHGKLFLEGIEDLRGETNLTPQAFGQIAGEQPEYLGCRARALVRWVFGTPNHGQRVKIVRDALMKEPTLRSGMKAALLQLAEELKQREQPTPAYPVAHTNLRELVEEQCIECHDSGWVSESPYSKDSLRRMLLSLSTGTMPPPDEGFISAMDRSQMINLAADALHGNEPAAEDFWQAPLPASLTRSQKLVNRMLGNPDNPNIPWVSDTNASLNFIWTFSLTAGDLCNQHTTLSAKQNCQSRILQAWSDSGF